MPASDLCLPEGAVLLHIGPHKTGTTSIQGALHRIRDELFENGVLVVAGLGGKQPQQAVLALTGARGLSGDSPPDIALWHRLVEQVNAAQDVRVIISSEFFDDADTETARRAVRELGGSRVHVVVTLRPLGKIMPSAWQQYVRNRLVMPYDEWLEHMLSKPPYDMPTPSFWRRHHHDVLVERWASIVGQENLTVIVVDESDRNALLRTFEELVDLPTGILIEDADRDNRSLTLGEIELVRRVNESFRMNKWPDHVYKQLIRLGMTRQLQTGRSPLPDEPRISTPQWALDRAAEIGATAAVKISARGVRIVGDISKLGAHLEANERTGSRSTYLAPDAAQQAIVGTIMGGILLDPERFVATIRAKDILRWLLGRAGLRVRNVGRNRQLRAAAGKAGDRDYGAPAG